MTTENPIPSPFLYSLLESDLYSEYETSDIRRMRELPHKFVRVASDSPENLASYLENRRILQSLPGKYGIAVPDFEIVIGPRAGQEVTYYTLVDKVYGYEMEYHDIKPKDIKHVRKLVDVLYSSIALYFWDVYREGGWYLDDVIRDNSQFVYGKRKGEKEKRIYLVDIEPRLEYLDVSKPESHERLFINAFNWLYELMKTMEYRVGSKLELTRATLLNFAKSIPSSHLSYWQVLEAKIGLEE